MPLSQKVAESDFIGVVRIGPISQLPKSAAGDSLWSYQRLADAEVIRSIKGAPLGAVLKIEFDNGFACPNATYLAGEEYLVFWKETGAGRYGTYNFYYGKFRVDDEQIAGWGESSRETDLLAVVDQVKELLDP